MTGMAIIRDSAVVLGRLDYSETSQVLVLLTRHHGKVRAIAKGIKRGTKTRFATAIDLLDVGEIVISSRQERPEGLTTVTEWKQTRSLSGLREKLCRIRGAEYVAEITGQLTEDFDPHTELYDDMVATLIDLSGASEPIGATVRYQLRLLESVGSLPRFDACMSCNRQDDLTHFSSFQGGMICRHCEPGQVEKWEVSPATLRTISNLLAIGPHTSQREPRQPPPEKSAKPEAVRAFGVLNYHIAHLMGREPHLAAKLVPAAQRRIIE